MHEKRKRKRNPDWFWFLGLSLLTANSVLTVTFRNQNLFVFGYSPEVNQFRGILINLLYPLFPQLPCGHEYCKSCVKELRQKGVDKSCPLCRKPLPPGPEKLYDLGNGMFMKIKGAISRPPPTLPNGAQPQLVLSVRAGKWLMW